MIALCRKAPWFTSPSWFSTGSFQFDCDTILVDGQKRALPWSKYTKLGDTWYRLEPQHAPTGIQVQVPPEVSQAVPFLTLRMIAHAAGIEN